MFVHCRVGEVSSTRIADSESVLIVSSGSGLPFGMRIPASKIDQNYDTKVLLFLPTVHLVCCNQDPQKSNPHHCLKLCVFYLVIASYFWSLSCFSFFSSSFSRVFLCRLLSFLFLFFLFSLVRFSLGFSSILSFFSRLSFYFLSSILSFHFLLSFVLSYIFLSLFVFLSFVFIIFLRLSRSSFC